MDRARAERALAHYDVAPTHVALLAGGLINSTFLVETSLARFVLQHLHPIFAGTVNEDIDVVTRHLAARGMTTPLIVRTRDGRLWLEEDGVWRMQTFVEGTAVQRVDSTARAESAGQLVGRFHASLTDLRHEFVFKRAGVHDTDRHYALLDEAITQHTQNALQPRAARLRDELVQLRSTLPAIHCPPRVVHGDLKISNLLFDDSGRGVCLVDLDTMGEMPLPFELGDAWRSWCNPLGEDDVHARFELDLLRAAWRGYAPEMNALITREERALLIAGVATISLELSARFLRDVLEDKYFGWDPARFPSRSAHNLVRAEGQASLARSILTQRAAAEAVVAH